MAHQLKRHTALSAISGLAAAVALALGLAGCAPPAETPPGNGRAAAPDRYADTLTADQIDAIANDVAQALLGDPLITDAKTAPVVVLKETEQPGGPLADPPLADPMMLLRAVKARAFVLGRGHLFFRDDALYPDLAQEQLKQANLPVDVRVEGDLDAAHSRTDGLRMVQTRNRVAVVEQGRIRPRLLDADYFLGAGIDRIIDRRPSAPSTGTVYTQFYFQLVDARTGLVVWDKMLHTVASGPLSPQALVLAAPGQAAPTAFLDHLLGS